MDYDTALRKVSTFLFGRPIRLPLAAWIRALPEGTSFYQLEAAVGIGCPPQYVQRELGRLRELGMVRRQHQEAGEIRQFYIADWDNPWWAIIDAAVGASSHVADPGAVTALHPFGLWHAHRECMEMILGRGASALEGSSHTGGGE